MNICYQFWWLGTLTLNPKGAKSNLSANNYILLIIDLYVLQKIVHNYGYLNFIKNFRKFSLFYDYLCNIPDFNSWSTKPQIFTIWVFTEKVFWPLIAERPQKLNIKG